MASKERMGTDGQGLLLRHKHGILAACSIDSIAFAKNTGCGQRKDGADCRELKSCPGLADEEDTYSFVRKHWLTEAFAPVGPTYWSVVARGLAEPSRAPHATAGCCFSQLGVRDRSILGQISSAEVRKLWGSLLYKSVFPFRCTICSGFAFWILRFWISRAYRFGRLLHLGTLDLMQFRMGWDRPERTFGPGHCF